MSARATLILVHGAWHGSWCWERFIPHLERAGVAVLAADLPSVQRETPGAPASVPIAADLSADAAAVRALIDAAPGPVVLCGHSYGGMVISLAARPGKVVHLAYLCAFMPAPGESLFDSFGGRSVPWIRTLESGLTLPDPALSAGIFYQDCDEATQAWACERLRPQSPLAFSEAVRQPAWRAIPSTYIVCSEDHALPPQMQRELFAPRATRSIALAAGHSPFLSCPAALAEVLAQAR